MKLKFKTLLISSVICISNLVFISSVYAEDIPFKNRNNRFNSYWKTLVENRAEKEVGEISEIPFKTPMVTFNKLLLERAEHVEETVTVSEEVIPLQVTRTPIGLEFIPVVAETEKVEETVVEEIEVVEEPKFQMGNFECSKGVFQGPWGDLTEYANQLTGNRGTRTRELLPYVGTVPVNEGADNYSYIIDRWRDVNGKGVVRYCQGGATAEEWNYLSSGDSNFVSSACGAYSAACVLSTMTGNYINVPEVAIAVNTYELRHPGSNLVLSNSDGDGQGAFKHTDLAAVISEAGLVTDVADNFDVNKVDECLDKGGLVIYVVNGKYNSRFTSNSHYIVIREKTIYGYLVYSSTNWSTPYDNDYCDRESTAEELANLQGYNGAQMVFVTYPN